MHNDHGMGGIVNNRIKKELKMKMLILGGTADLGSWAQWRMNTVYIFENQLTFMRIRIHFSIFIYENV